MADYISEQKILSFKVPSECDKKSDEMMRINLNSYNLSLVCRVQRIYQIAFSKFDKCNSGLIKSKLLGNVLR